MVYLCLLTNKSSVSLACKIGQASAFGLRELHLIDKPKPVPIGATDPTVNPIKVFAEQLQRSGLLSGATSLEKIRLLANNAFIEDMYQRTIVFNPQIEAFITQEKPDLIIVDQNLMSPAIMQSGIPYVLIFSGNPLMLYNSEQLPPPCSGYATNSDPDTWAEFWIEFEKGFFFSLSVYQKRINETFNYKPAEKPDKERQGPIDFPLSPYLNIYGYPEELDYQDIVPLQEKVFGVDAFCRNLPKPFTIPEVLKVSLGFLLRTY